MSHPHAAGGAALGTGHAEGAHGRFLAHHFDSQAQQFDAGKLGMWLFLAQEILFFSGLFCAYALYRSHHPEIFVFADQFLDRRLGALNTGVLILSSFTMAWAVRAAQLGQRRLLVGLLAATFACAAAFMAVKVVEYHHKFADGLLWGKNFHPSVEALEHVKHLEHAEAGPGQLHMHRTQPTEVYLKPLAIKNVHIFFGIYFAMTGLHGIHILAGMGVIAWLITRARRGDFSGSYYGPVEFTALYWHLVDLVWIFLFPMLYLIH